MPLAKSEGVLSKRSTRYPAALWCRSFTCRKCSRDGHTTICSVRAAEKMLEVFRRNILYGARAAGHFFRVPYSKLKSSPAAEGKRQNANVGVSAKPDAIVRLGKPGTTGLDQDQNLGQVGTREVKIGTRPARTGTKARINGTKLGRRRTGFRRFCVQSRNTPKEACGGFLRISTFSATRAERSKILMRNGSMPKKSLLRKAQNAGCGRRCPVTAPSFSFPGFSDSD